MPVLWLIALLISSITFANAADSAKGRALPLLEETGDPEKKAEYLESIPYRPCPSAVRCQTGSCCVWGRRASRTNGDLIPTVRTVALPRTQVVPSNAEPLPHRHA
jgi:hypothetical protein